MSANQETLLYIDHRPAVVGSYDRYASVELTRSACRQFWESGDGWHRFVLDDFGALAYVRNTEARIEILCATTS